jgi:hypothetical protein
MEMEVVNYGNVEELLTIEPNPLPDWEFDIQESVVIGPYDEMVLDFVLTPPPRQLCGEYDVNLTMRDGQGNEKIVEFPVEIGPWPSINLNIYPREILFKHDSTNHLSFYFDNMGNMPMNVTLEIRLTEPGWGLSLLENGFHIDVGDSYGLDAVIKTPVTTAAGEYPIDIVWTAVNGSWLIEREFSITAVVEEYINFTAELKEEHIADVEPGAQISNVVSIINGGNTELEFERTLFDLPDGWEVKPLTPPYGIEMNSEGEALFKLTVSENALPGEYEYTVSVECSDITQNLTGKVQVQSVYDFDLTATLGLVEVKQGESVQVMVDILNKGNTKDSYKLSLTGPSWTILSKSKLTLDVDETGTAAVVVSPGDSLEPGNYAVAVEATSEDGKNTKRVQVEIIVKENPALHQTGAASNAALWGGLILLLLILLVVGLMVALRKNWIKPGSKRKPLHEELEEDEGEYLVEEDLPGPDEEPKPRKPRPGPPEPEPEPEPDDEFDMPPADEDEDGFEFVLDDEDVEMGAEAEKPAAGPPASVSKTKPSLREKPAESEMPPAEHRETLIEKPRPEKKPGPKPESKTEPVSKPQKKLKPADEEKVDDVLSSLMAKLNE